MSTVTVSPLRQRMIEDMKARQLGVHTRRSHVYSCKRFAAYLKRSPETATADEVRAFQLYLMETGPSICNRNRIMTGVKFLFRVTLRRLDLAAEIYHIREPQKIPLVMSQDETRRLLAVGSSLKARTLFSLGYGCGLRASEVVRLKVKHIDRAQTSFGSSSPRAARTAMSCCPPRCSICCGNGGRCAHRIMMPERRCRNAGCFPAPSTARRCRPASSTACFMRLPMRPGSGRA